ncbi:MAG: cytochrome c biogenesis protein CcsA [Planctomycetes bacterium]|nr:cytochrome c biogenesis protein CcsA [Planctomycetota bacterium]
MSGAVWWAELAAALCWLLAAGAAVQAWRRPGWDPVVRVLGAAGLAIAGSLLAWLWIHLDRPPLRTLGETRLWYAILSVAAGGLLAWRLRTTALRVPMLLLGVLFLALNLALPQTLDRTLMPALRSPWFVPHVVVYLLSYAVLGLSAGVAAWHLLRRRDDGGLAFRLVHAGLPLLTIGLCLGAIWAKEAWGHYWAWDPKETWALLTWIVYVCLIHAERDLRDRPRLALAVITGAFTVVLMCWFLVNYLPSTAVSVHTYTRQ